MSNPCDYGMCNASECDDKECNSQPELFPKCYRLWGRTITVYLTRNPNEPHIVSQRKHVAPRGLSATKRDEWVRGMLEREGFKNDA